MEENNVICIRFVFVHVCTVHVRYLCVMKKNIFVGGKLAAEQKSRDSYLEQVGIECLVS